jgi:N-hydroxyarylamine O-acetyltransferase
MDVEAYLRRIQYDGPREPSLETLRELHRQHLFTVPFENLDIALRNPIQLDPELIYQKVVLRGRGGYCYELNGLFHELLEALGFTVCMLSAQVRRDDGSFGPDFDHMLLKATLDEPWIADVGFGDSFVDPLPLVPGTCHEGSGKLFGVASENGGWRVFKQDDDGQVPLYRFSDVPRHLADFENMNTYQQTSPESGFTRRRVCSKATPDGRITLSGVRLIVTKAGERQERVLEGKEELRQCLREHFGIELAENVDWSKLTG